MTQAIYIRNIIMANATYTSLYFRADYYNLRYCASKLCNPVYDAFLRATDSRRYHNNYMVLSYTSVSEAVRQRSE